MKITYQLLICFLIYSCVAQFPIDDEVDTAIPGYPHTFYSGYLDITIHTIKKSVHYVYFESQSNPTKDPIIVWLAGGPGCSGMMSMLQQNGPFVFRPGSKSIQINKNAWNKNAGLVYFENPAGVGFSTGNEGNDTIHEQDAVNQLQTTLNLFVARHIKLRSNDFYFAGSGYGAVFATYLARRVVDWNKQLDHTYVNKIQLKGILLGNPCVNPQECYNSGSQKNSIYHYQFLHKRGFLTKHQFNQFQGYCMMDYNSLPCYTFRKTLDDFVAQTSTSVYNIYNKCYKSTKTNTINLGCEDQDATIDYFNDEHFKQNWNINSSKKWEPCSQNIWTRYSQGNGTFHLIHQLAITDNIRVWVYSGDTDSTIPFIGTKYWVNHYKNHYEIPIKKNWREWWVRGLHTKENQVGGFVWELFGLTVVAVKGAGFHAATDQPAAMDEVVTAFITNTNLPYKHDLKISQQ